VRYKRASATWNSRVQLMACKICPKTSLCEGVLGRDGSTVLFPGVRLRLPLGDWTWYCRAHLPCTEVLLSVGRRDGRLFILFKYEQGEVASEARFDVSPKNHQSAA